MSPYGVPVVLYHYDGSPFATKAKNMLTLMKIPHRRVKVNYMLPRPELSDLLGVTYRRIPVLAIGRDLYCDTSAITSALERHFPTSEGYGTVFPPRKDGGKIDKAVMKVFAGWYVESAIFLAVTDHLPYDKLAPDFLKDRSTFFGGPIDPKAIAARRDATKSTLFSHMALLEEQLADGREWLMDTETPSLADISAHFVLAWTCTMRTLVDLIDPKTFPKASSWLARTSKYISDLEKANAAPFDNITGEAAAKLIGSSEDIDTGVIGFDEVEAKRLGIKQGEVVSVTPKDTGRIPTVGRLIALSREVVVIETKGTINVPVRVHFPRLNFSVKKGEERARL